MSTPQPGIFAVGAAHHVHLEFELVDDAGPEQLAQVLASLTELRQVTAGINLVVGIAPRHWRRIAPENCPVSAEDFEPVGDGDGDEPVFPATQHDAWVWIATGSRDAAFDAARDVVRAVGNVASLTQEATGFAYHDSRDLSGFIDGTANRPLDEAVEVAVVGPGAPGAGSSVVLVQRWVHDLDALHSLDVPDQEAVFGTTKTDGEELDPLPRDAHIARVEIEDDNGEELEIFRRSVPIGNLHDAGLQFVAFSADRTILEVMLAAMAAVSDGVRDRLLDFSTPVSGSYYVTPSVEVLRRFAS